MTISYEAIYTHIYSHRQARLNRKLIALLPYHKTQRRRANKNSKRGIKIKNQTSIDDRPKHIETREEIGHWEGDLVIGKGQRSAIGTLVERRSRFTFIVKLENRKSATVRKGFVKELKKAQNALNNRPRKVLGYRTPNQIMEMEFLKNKNKKYGDDVTAC